MRPSSPLLDSVRDLFEGHDQMARDFARAFVFSKEFARTDFYKANKVRFMATLQFCIWLITKFAM